LEINIIAFILTRQAIVRVAGIFFFQLFMTPAAPDSLEVSNI